MKKLGKIVLMLEFLASSSISGMIHLKCQMSHPKSNFTAIEQYAYIETLGYLSAVSSSLIYLYESGGAAGFQGSQNNNRKMLTWFGPQRMKKILRKVKPR